MNKNNNKYQPKERADMKQSIKKSTGLCWLIVTVIVFLIDFGSKLWITSRFFLNESIDILPFFSITYARNTGAGFSLFAGQRLLLAMIAIVISLFILYMLYKNQRNKKIENISLALILGGALGNLFDRIYHGYVVDFLDVSFASWHYPTFNFADCMICVGIALFLFATHKTKDTKNVPTDSSKSE